MTETASLTLNHILSHYLVKDEVVIDNIIHILEITSSSNVIALANPGAMNKLNTRLLSLVTSKVTSAKYSAICLIYQFSTLPILEKYGAAWVNSLLNIVQRRDTEVVLSRTIKTLEAIFHTTTSNSAVHRAISTPNLPKFVSSLLNLRDLKFILPEILDALANTCITFPNTFKSFVTQTQTLCLDILLNSNSTFASAKIERHAARCLISLHLAGYGDARKRGGEDNVADQWKTTLITAIGTMHAALDIIFSPIKEDFNSINFYPSWPFKHFDANIAIPLWPFTIIEMMTLFVDEALRNPTTRPVSLPLEVIFGVARRIYSVTRDSHRRETVSTVAHTLLESSLPRLYVQANRVISSLIQASKDQFTPQVGNTVSFLADILRAYGGSSLALSQYYELCTSTLNLLCDLTTQYGPGILVRDKTSTKGIEALYVNTTQNANVVSAVMQCFAFLVHPLLYPEEERPLSLTESKSASQKNKKRKIGNGNGNGDESTVEEHLKKHRGLTQIEQEHQCQIASFKVIFSFLMYIPNDIPRTTLDAVLARIAMQSNSPKEILSLVHKCMCAGGLMPPLMDDSKQGSIFDWRPKRELRKLNSESNFASLLPIAIQLINHPEDPDLMQTMQNIIHPIFPPFKVKEPRIFKNDIPEESTSDGSENEVNEQTEDDESPGKFSQTKDEMELDANIKIGLSGSAFESNTPSNFFPTHRIESAVISDSEKASKAVVQEALVTPIITYESFLSKVTQSTLTNIQELPTQSAEICGQMSDPAEELDEDDMPEIIMDESDEEE